MGHESNDKSNSVWAWLSYPVLASMIRSRKLAAVLSVVLVLQLLTVLVKIPGIECPLLKTTGVPCPGCGLTRGAVATVKLDWNGLLHYNLFGPLALLAVCIILVGAVLPGNARERYASGIASIEKHTGITNLCFVALWGYWAFRLLHSHGELGSSLAVSWF